MCKENLTWIFCSCRNDDRKKDDDRSRGNIKDDRRPDRKPTLDRDKSMKNSIIQITKTNYYCFFQTENNLFKNKHYKIALDKGYDFTFMKTLRKTSQISSYSDVF